MDRKSGEELCDFVICSWYIVDSGIRRCDNVFVRTTVTAYDDNWNKCPRSVIAILHRPPIFVLVSSLESIRWRLNERAVKTKTDAYMRFFSFLSSFDFSESCLSLSLKILFRALGRTNTSSYKQTQTTTSTRKKITLYIYHFRTKLGQRFSSLEQSFRGRCSVRHRIVGLSSSCGCHFELSANSITRRNRASLLARPEMRGLSFSVSG